MQTPIEVRYAIACEHFRNESRGSATVLGFRGVLPVKTHLAEVGFTLAFYLRFREAGSTSVRLRLVDQEGKDVFGTEGPRWSDVESDRTRTGVLVVVMGGRIKELLRPGAYDVLLETKEGENLFRSELIILSPEEDPDQ